MVGLFLLPRVNVAGYDWPPSLDGGSSPCNVCGREASDIFGLDARKEGQLSAEEI
jgi:hypothetical protein